MLPRFVKMDKISDGELFPHLAFNVKCKLIWLANNKDWWGLFNIIWCDMNSEIYVVIFSDDMYTSIAFCTHSCRRNEMCMVSENRYRDSISFWGCRITALNPYAHTNVCWRIVSQRVTNLCCKLLNLSVVSKRVIKVCCKWLNSSVLSFKLCFNC